MMGNQIINPRRAHVEDPQCIGQREAKFRGTRTAPRNMGPQNPRPSTIRRARSLRLDGWLIRWQRKLLRQRIPFLWRKLCIYLVSLYSVSCTSLIPISSAGFLLIVVVRRRESCGERVYFLAQGCCVQCLLEMVEEHEYHGNAESVTI
jgi:hypothetical protein